MIWLEVRKEKVLRSFITLKWIALQEAGKSKMMGVKVMRNGINIHEILFWKIYS